MALSAYWIRLCERGGGARSRRGVTAAIHEFVTSERRFAIRTRMKVSICLQMSTLAASSPISGGTLAIILRTYC